ncbi:MAG: D-glycero-beta-D-manno-heptose 1-phosphate adenylyltransferase [Candidatus Omnitrophica bacterium]|nr:D-glycero-beta-D-manno-heptose 1-phosphate adenylyltransferase [Candidatus Omnitrophota bacterium]
MNKKIKSLKTLSLIRQRLKKEKKRVVFTNGCFDILHRGHITYLRKAKAYGDVLIVGLNRDGSVRRLKGPTRPIMCEADRAEVMSELESIDYIVLFSDDTPLKVVTALKPDVLVKGSDWSLEKIVGKTVLDSYGGVVKRVTLVQGKSTSNLIKKMQKHG